MWYEGISTDLREFLVRALRIGGAVPNRLSRLQWSNWLRWQQWLVLFGMGAALILIEVHNHRSMWQAHQSNQTVWTDRELIWEIILSGLIFPILAGIALGYMGRAAGERDEMARELELRRALVLKMQEAQSWPELTELVVTTPGEIAAADRAWLLAQRSKEEEFDQIAYWQRPESGPVPLNSMVFPIVCRQCADVNSLKETRILNCQRSNSENGAFHYNRYCLWLSSEKTGKTALLFDVPFNISLGQNQMKILDDLGDEMSLAIDNANLHYLNQRQVDVAQNERQKIARDLHDTLAQNVSYLRLKLEQLSTTPLIFDDTSLQKDLSAMLMVASEAYEQVRDTLEELRMTESRNLNETVQMFAAQAADRAGLSVQVHSTGKPGMLPARKSRQIIYILREALNNVVNHANAQNVDIYLNWGDSDFTLRVCDDGEGFQPEDLNKEQRYGMAIMDERSRTIDADLTIKANPGKGTQLTLNVPISSSANS